MRSSMTFMVTCPVAKHSNTNDKYSHESSVTLRFAPNCHQMPHLVSTLAVGDVSVVMFLHIRHHIPAKSVRYQLLQPQEIIWYPLVLSSSS